MNITFNLSSDLSQNTMLSINNNSIELIKHISKIHSNIFIIINFKYDKTILNLREELYEHINQDQIKVWVGVTHLTNKHTNINSSIIDDCIFEELINRLDTDVIWNLPLYENSDSVIQKCSDTFIQINNFFTVSHQNKLELIAIPTLINHLDKLNNTKNLDSFYISYLIEKTDIKSGQLTQKIFHYVENLKSINWQISSELCIQFLKILFSCIQKNRIQTKASSTQSQLIKSISHKINSNYTKAQLKLSATCINNNFPSLKRKKQLLIDISKLAQKDDRTGEHRVVKAILNELLLQKIDEYEIRIIYATHSNPYRYCPTKILKKIVTSQYSQKNENKYISVFSGDVFFILDYSIDINLYYKQYYLDLKKIGIAIHFVIHDIIPLSHSHWFFSISNSFAELIIDMLKVCQTIICVSKTTAHELEKWMSDNLIVKSKNLSIEVNHNGVYTPQDIKNKKIQFSYGQDKSILKIFKKIENKTNFLMLGTLSKRKGYKQVIEAFELLWKKKVEINLIIVGKKGWLVDNLINKILKHKTYNKNLFWLENISDECLEEVYKYTNCLIAASEHEGFGLPIVEAAARKISVIARDIPVFKEIGRDSIFYFNGNKGNDIAIIIEFFLNTSQNRLNEMNKIPFISWQKNVTQLKKIIM